METTAIADPRRRTIGRRLGALWTLSCLCLALQSCVLLPGARPVAGLIRNDEVPAAPVTIPATIDNNRMLVTLSFLGRNGRARPALAWVNMGMGGLSLAPRLREELGGAGPVAFTVGGVPVTAEPGAILSASEEDFAQQLGPRPVEAVLPAGVLRLFRVTFDYAGGTLTLAPPSAAAAPGVAVPVRMNEGTGLIGAEARVDGRPYPVVIDAGAGYTWWRGEVVREWLRAHPDWQRAEGAPGRSNQAMVGQAFEQAATVVRVPDLQLGSLHLYDVGILGSGPARGGMIDPLIGRIFWNAWEKGAPGPVAGWLGGNVLSQFRLTIDYPHRMTYWQRVAPPTTDELDAVGLSLVHTSSGYRVGALVRRNGTEPASGVRPGDELSSVDGRNAAAMTREDILRSLHGRPGDRHRLTLQRDGRRIEVVLPVNAY